MNLRDGARNNESLFAGRTKQTTVKESKKATQPSSVNRGVMWYSSKLQELIDKKNEVNETMAELCVEYILTLDKSETKRLITNVNGERDNVFKNLLNGVSEAERADIMERAFFIMLSKLM